MNAINIVSNVKGRYFISYLQYYERWKHRLDDLSDLILVPKTAINDISKVIYKLKEFGKNHYLLYRRNYKNDFYKDLVKYDNYKKIMDDKIKGSIYDITSFRWTSIREVADIVADLTGAKVFAGNKEGLSHKDLPSHNKIPGWEAKVNLEEGIGTMVENYRQKYEIQNGNSKA